MSPSDRYPGDRPESILFVHFGGVGDLVMDIPLLRDLSGAFGPDSIRILGSKGTRLMLRMGGLGHLSDVSEAQGWHRHTALARQLAGRTDAVLFGPGTHLKRAWQWTRFARPRISLVAQVDFPDEVLAVCDPPKESFTRVIGPCPGRHKVELGFAMLRWLGVEPDTRFPRFDFEDPVFASRTSEVEPNVVAEPFAVLHFGAQNQEGSKALPVEFWTAAIPEIQRRFGLRCVLVGGPDVTTYAMEIEERLGSPSYVSNLVERLSLPALARLCGRAHVVVGPDSGPAHVAAAGGAPVLTLFGPTKATQCAPFSDRSWALSKTIDCGPCYWSERYVHCPRGRECLTSFSPEVVLEALGPIVQGSSTVGGLSRPGFELRRIGVD